MPPVFLRLALRTNFFDNKRKFWQVLQQNKILSDCLKANGVQKAFPNAQRLSLRESAEKKPRLCFLLEKTISPYFGLFLQQLLVVYHRINQKYRN